MAFALLLLLAIAAAAPAEPGPSRVALVGPSKEAASFENLGTPDTPASGTEAAQAAARSVALSVRTLTGVLDTFRIPFDIVTQPQDLADYPVAYLSGGFYNDVLEEGWSNALYRYVEDGGILVSPSPVGSSLYPLFGVEEREPSRTRYRLHFTGDDPALSYVDHPREETISLGNGPRHIYDEVIWSHGYSVSGEAEVLARFDDESPGLVRHFYGRGMGYLLGLSWVESVMLPKVGHDYEAQRDFVNSFEPSADVILLFVKAIYESFGWPAVYLHPIPNARPTALILSHDVDAQTSFVDSLKFARLAEEFDTSATFFENTKYFTDWKDIAYYSVPENKEAIRELARRGFDIGSHTVSHYTELDTAPLGDPDVTYAEYDPTEQVTLYGEVRVSKQLLDADIPGQNTVAFRAGDLAFHDGLIGVLEDAGYLYDSTFSANDVLTTFPFFAARRRVPFSRLSNVLEIPLTLDDSLGFLTPETVDHAAETWIDVLEANAANTSITVLLNHPSDTRDHDHKLRAQRRLMKRAEEMGAWMGDLTSFGEFWRGRHQVSISVSRVDETIDITLRAGGEDIDPRLALVIKNVEDDRSIILRDENGAELTYVKRRAPTSDSSFHLTDISR
jgi:peptidoglycan/xylan/chitin deacetylase (PgdA/CDA1 family)